MKMLQKRVLLISMVTVFQLHGVGNNALTEGGKDWSRMITITRFIKTGCGAGIVGVGAHAVLSNTPLGDCFSEMPPSLKALLPLVAAYVVSDAVGDYARDKQLQKVRAHLQSHATALGEHGTRLDGIDSALKDQTQRVDAMESTVTEWQKLCKDRAERLASRPASSIRPASAVFDDITAEVTERALKNLSRPGSQIGAGQGVFRSLAAAGNGADNGDGSGATS